MKIKIDRCPFCGSDRGFEIIEKVRRALMFDFDGEPDGATEDVVIYAGKVAYCSNCGKSLSKKYVEVE